MASAVTRATTEELKSYIERIERVVEQMVALKDDQKLLFAEAKAKGFDTKAMRRTIKRRQKEPAEIAEQESIDAIYMHALGMVAEHPLHAQVAAMAGDGLAREGLIDALQLLVPINGEIIAKVGGAPMRLWRTEDGRSFAEPYAAPATAPSAAPAAKRKTSASVLSIVPKDPVQAAADRAERRSASARRHDDEETLGADSEHEPEPVA
jgi:uncharacterized protein (UPF0335 family)